MEENKLFAETKPLKLFFLLALPGMVSMLMSSLYGVIDGICVGQILGKDAFAAVNLVMPLVIVTFAFADLIGVGSAVPIAIKLGEKNEKDACNIFTCSVVFILVGGTVLGLGMFVFADEILRLLGADETLAIPAASYLRVISAFCPIASLLFAVDNYLKICGKIGYSMFVNILMSGLCIVVEILFLGVFGLGLWAAALAFTLSITVSVLVGFLPFFTGKQQLRFVKPRFDRKLFVTVFSNGLPAFLFNIAGRVSSILMNVYLLRLGGATAVAAYGILMYTDGIAQPVLYGICDSIQPAVGYNYGARKLGRIKSLEKICFSVCAGISVVMAALMWFASEPLSLMFMSEGDGIEVIEMASYSMKFIAVSYLIRWFCLCAQSFMTAVGKVRYATLISICTALIFPVAFIYILVPTMGLDALWANMPAASVLTAVLAGVLFVMLLREMRRQANS